MPTKLIAYSTFQHVYVTYRDSPCGGQWNILFKMTAKRDSLHELCIYAAIIGIVIVFFQMPLLSSSHIWPQKPFLPWQRRLRLLLIVIPYAKLKDIKNNLLLFFCICCVFVCSFFHLYHIPTELCCFYFFSPFFLFLFSLFFLLQLFYGMARPELRMRRRLRRPTISIFLIRSVFCSLPPSG